MIDEHAASDLRGGMDLDTGEKSRHLGEETGRRAQAMIPQPVKNAMCPKRVQSGIAGDYFQPGLGGRVTIEDRGDVFSHRSEEANHTETAAVAIC
jgi:hypothetical protein